MFDTYKDQALRRQRDRFRLALLYMGLAAIGTLFGLIIASI